MAARYIAELRMVPARRGPTISAAIPWAGLIAYEMAQQLRAAGGTVGLLALLDTYQYHGRHRLGHLPVWIEPEKVTRFPVRTPAPPPHNVWRCSSRFLALHGAHRPLARACSARSGGFARFPAWRCRSRCSGRSPRTFLRSGPTA